MLGDVHDDKDNTFTCLPYIQSAINNNADKYEKINKYWYNNKYIGVRFFSISQKLFLNIHNNLITTLLTDQYKMHPSLYRNIFQQINVLILVTSIYWIQ